MMKSICVLVLAAFTAAALSAQTIDFETLPDGSPATWGIRITNQYAAAYGVSFRFEDGTAPVTRLTGGSNNGKPTAFWGWPDNTGFNTPAPEQNIGNVFLSDNGAVGAPPAPLLITYSVPVAAASGFILDIDHDEAWDVQALNISSQVVAQVHLQAGAPLTGDGIATPWSFVRPSADLGFIRVLFTGDKKASVGLAFDNFSPALTLPAPTPPSLGFQFENNIPFLRVAGRVASVYRIDATSSLANPDWTPLTSIILSSPSVTLTNLPLSGTGSRFYRVVGVQ